MERGPVAVVGFMAGRALALASARLWPRLLRSARQPTDLRCVFMIIGGYRCPRFLELRTCVMQR